VGRGGGRGGRGAAPPAGPPPTPGFPRGYDVAVSLDGTSWTTVASGEGAPLTIASFAPVEAKFVRITQTADAPDAPAWVVQNLRLFRAP
ncbi:MAG: discoidin domain-containing protein, partial [Acidobacteriota bacterium]